MDKGRQIDNTQNVNARWIDQFNQSNKTSVKISNPPGGKSSFSLGWTDPEPVPQRNAATNRYDNKENNVNNNQGNVNCGNLKNSRAADNGSSNLNKNNNFDNVKIFFNYNKI